jgi:solute carrier family 39 (zinc transporter), member 9
MGVLVGTSLIVIIPEGVDTLYSASLVAKPPADRIASRSLFSAVVGLAAGLPERDAGESDGALMPGPVLPASLSVPPPTPTEPGRVGILEEDSDKSGGDHPSSQAASQRHDASPHAWMGVALITGFILMYLIDKLPEYTSSSKSATQPYHISLNDLGRGLHRARSADQDSEANGFLQGSSAESTRSRASATTTGLVIHAAADGIALGASSSTANTGLSFIIFLAIMVHKAPAAFGLTSVLLKQGLSKRTARAHLLLFSSAAPTGAILTWLFAHTLGAGRMDNAQSTKWWTGMLLLFSGGTFLYVAMHTMQEVGRIPHDIQMNGQVDGLGENRDARIEAQKPSPKDLMAAVFGMILPLVLQVGHAH